MELNQTFCWTEGGREGGSKLVSKWVSKQKKQDVELHIFPKGKGKAKKNTCMLAGMHDCFHLHINHWINKNDQVNTT